MFRFGCIGLLLLFGSMAAAQSVDWKSFPEKYVEVLASTREDVSALAERYVVDNVKYDSSLYAYAVRLWLPSGQYDNFTASGIPYREPHATKAAGDMLMAWSYEEMSEWNRYPTYDTYLAMMDTFARRYPDLCSVDTILAATPGHHALLAAHIAARDSSVRGKPAFFYSSSIHGDEIAGFVLLLRLIDYLLTHYPADEQVKEIVDQVDLWICPLENPDGTYYYSNDTLGQSPISTRANYAGRDLNRSYPWIGQENVTLLPEAAAMVRFFQEKHFTMSAVLHGGAEVFNYPWDSWTTRVRKHPDDNWWLYVGRMFASLCQQNSPNGYFEDEQAGVTAGGDWYVIHRGRQDYMNYFQHCREVTLEIMEEKVPAVECLPDLWNYTQQALLKLILESTHGIGGRVTDAVTGEPVVAKIAIPGHDDESSWVYADASGYYRRPLQQGIFKVAFSAEGYRSKTIDMSVQNGTKVEVNVALDPIVQSLPEKERGLLCALYPNPAHTFVKIVMESDVQGNCDAVLFNAQGQQLKSLPITQREQILNMEDLPVGTYVVVVSNGTTKNLLKIVKY